MNVKGDIFTSAKVDDAISVKEVLVSGENDVNEVNDEGLTGLHICATYGSVQALLVYLQHGADLNMKDKESGWTPLHRSLYFGHLRVSIILIQSGAILDGQISMSNRMLSNIKLNPLDNDGMTPGDLLLNALAPTLSASRSKVLSSNLLCFGKSDFTLGVPLPKSSEVVQPKRVETLLNECVIQVCASKYHSVAATSDGNVYSWGHGRGGRLGHGDEASQPEPMRIPKFGPNTRIHISCIANGENHTIAVSSDGAVYSWGADRYGQLGLGGSSHDGTRIVLSPRRIESLRREYVVLIAAGDVHSLCGTQDGVVFSWGSNKNGQLGLKPTEMSRLSTGELGVATPKRVHIDALSNYTRQSSSKIATFSHTNSNIHGNNRKIFDLSAGHDNSLLLCRGYTGHGSPNEVYQWGHGIFNPARVVFSGRKPRTFSIVRDDSKHHCKRSSSSDGYIAVGAGEAVHVLSICTGQHHYAALTKDGSVYTWGVSSERDSSTVVPVVDSMSEVARSEEVSRTRYSPSPPQLVEALLPGRGGGRIVSIAAAVNRTCAVTELGELYTWAAPMQKVNGLARTTAQESVVVNKVAGVYRAVSVSASIDHTLVLCATSLPLLPLSQHPMFQELCPQTGRPLPPPVNAAQINVHQEDVFAVDDAPLEDTIEGSLGGSEGELLDVEDDQIATLDTAFEDDDSSYVDEGTFSEGTIPSLHALCERELAKSVNVKTAINAMVFADQFGAELLQTYSSSFIQMNFDAILTQTKASDLDNCAAAMGFIPHCTAGSSHSSKAESMAAYNTSTSSSTTKASALYTQRSGGGSGKATTVSTIPATTTTSRKLLTPTTALNLQEGEEVKRLTSADIMKLIKANKKKLAAIEELYTKNRDTSLILTKEQRDKIDRKGNLQQEVANLEQLLVRCQVRERKEESNTLVTAENPEKRLSSTDQVHDQTAAGKENNLPATECTMKTDDVDRNMQQQTAVVRQSDHTGNSTDYSVGNSAGKTPKKKQSRGISLQEFNRIASGTTATASTPINTVPNSTITKSSPWGARSAVQEEDKAGVLCSDEVDSVLKPQRLPTSTATPSSPRGTTTPSTVIPPSQLGTLVDSRTPKGSTHTVLSGCSAGQLPSRRTHALLDFLPGAKTTIPLTPPAKSRAGWGTPPVSTAVVSSTGTSHNSIGKLPSKPVLSLNEIQRAEEAARQASAVTSLRGNTVPWLIERRPRADSMEAVVRQQLWEKQEEEEIQAAIAEIERVTREQELAKMKKPGSNKKDKRKNYKKPSDTSSRK